MHVRPSRPDVNKVDNRLTRLHPRQLFLVFGGKLDCVPCRQSRIFQNDVQRAHQHLYRRRCLFGNPRPKLGCACTQRVAGSDLTAENLQSQFKSALTRVCHTVCLSLLTSRSVPAQRANDAAGTDANATSGRSDVEMHGPSEGVVLSPIEALRGTQVLLYWWPGTNTSALPHVASSEWRRQLLEARCSSRVSFPLKFMS